MFKFSMSRLILSISLLSIVNISNAAYTITPDTINFEAVTLGSGLQPEITITNTGDSVLQLGGIASTDPLALPFRIYDPGCANSFIQPGRQCSVTVLFEPTSLDTFNDSLNIDVISEGASDVVQLNGYGVDRADEPDILLTFASVDFGVVDVLESADQPYVFPPVGSPLPFLIQNKGAVDLDISEITVSGTDASEITIQGDCVGIITPSNYCAFLIDFKPLTTGSKNAEISFFSNDLDEDPFILPIRGIAAAEDDGVPAVIEDAGPNNGDASNDDILDSRQSNVATFIDAYGKYVTYIVNAGYNFKNMTALQSTSVATIPANVTVGSGIFDFTIEGVAPGGLVEVGMILPVGFNPGAYYIYGETADNSVKDWYDFTFDGETGTIIRGDVTFTTSTGEKFSGSVLSLGFKDGGRGDTDMVENGVITVTSAISVRSSSSDGGGFIGLLQLLCLTSLLILTRRFSNLR